MYLMHGVRKELSERRFMTTSSLLADCKIGIYLCNGMLETSNFNSCNRQLRYFQPHLIACNSLIGYSGFARNGTTPRRKNQK